MYFNLIWEISSYLYSKFFFLKCSQDYPPLTPKCNDNGPDKICSDGKCYRGNCTTGTFVVGNCTCGNDCCSLYKTSSLIVLYIFYFLTWKNEMIFDQQNCFREYGCSFSLSRKLISSILESGIKKFNFLKLIFNYYLRKLDF